MLDGLVTEFGRAAKRKCLEGREPDQCSQGVVGDNTRIDCKRAEATEGAKRVKVANAYLCRIKVDHFQVPQPAKGTHLAARQLVSVERTEERQSCQGVRVVVGELVPLPQPGGDNRRPRRLVADETILADLSNGSGFVGGVV